MASNQDFACSGLQKPEVLPDAVIARDSEVFRLKIQMCLPGHQGAEEFPEPRKNSVIARVPD